MSVIRSIDNGTTWSGPLEIFADVIVSTTILFFGSLSLVIGGFIGTEFVSMGDRGEIIIQMELQKNATIEQTNQATLLAEKY